MESKGNFKGWIASLSNGDTVFEQKDVPNEPSAWRKLVTRCDREKLHITQIRLQLDGLTFVGVPDADGYCTYWKYFKSVFTGKEIHTRCIGSVFGDKVYVIEVFDDGNIKQDLVDLSEVKLHCIMK